MTSPRTLRHKRVVAAAAVALVLALILASCGGDSDDGDSGSAGAASTPTTVSVDSFNGLGDVLVDSEGAALYTADQERDGKVRCTDDCAEIWIPLTLSAGDEPSGPDQVSGELGVTERPGGQRQVSLGGRPLYRFADDTAGGVTGDGLSDTFGGTLFSWDVVTVGRAASEPAQPSLPGPY
jgi:predicted lipoprotein with Yx(FWY)xxD motif